MGGSKEAQIKKYGGEAQYRAEMKRRASLRAKIGVGKRFNTESGKRAAERRWYGTDNN